MLDSFMLRRWGARIFSEASTVLTVAFLVVNLAPYEAPRPLWTGEDLPNVADDELPAFDRREQHRIEASRAVELARAGDVAGSGRRLRELIQTDLARLEHAHTLIGFVVALGNLAEALEGANVVVERVDPDEVSPNTRAVLAELGETARAIDGAAIDLERVVIGEYLAHLEAIERLEVPVGSRWLYSRELTLREINERYEHRHRRAAEHDTAGALGSGQTSPKQEFGWWFRNPIGKHHVEGTLGDFGRVGATIDEGIEQVDRRRARLLAWMDHRQIS